MATTDDTKADQWSAQANLYSNQAARLTELHGADLVTLLKDEILHAKTILDVGSGTGAFAKAYLQQFPNGIPGQTIILTDISSGMLEKAKEGIRSSEGETKFVFQEEDGTKLTGIPDGSIDLVVSLFGVFLIPDQVGTRNAVRRVLKRPNGVVAIVSWQFGISSDLTKLGYGPSLQDAFLLPIKIIDPENATFDDGPLKAWSTKEGAYNIMSADYEMKKVDIHHSIHSSPWEFDSLWDMIAKNPMSNVKDATKEQAEKAKSMLKKFVTQQDNHSHEQPILFSTASNLCIGRGVN